MKAIWKPSCGSGARFQEPWKAMNAPEAYAAPSELRGGTKASCNGAQWPGKAITGWVFCPHGPCLTLSPPYSGASIFFFAIGS